MTTNELLACVTPGANDYIQTTINTKNKADYQKLKKLFDEQQFEAKSFEDSDLDILTFDWQSLERDRNWWWQLQALPFVNWYANSFSLQSEEERTRYLSLCLKAIHNWVNQAKQNKASPLAWHDHAAAFRVRNLTNWLVFCHSSSLPLGEEPSAELLGSLIIEHLDWLQEDKHYSKRTNHGFDQAMIALTIASMFSSNDFEAYRLRNRERLKDEVTFAFTDEGVHKENSPGYQKMMLGRLKQLTTLASLGEREISQMGERFIDKAEAFLRAITLPNGYLPMIGDTRGGDEGLPYEQQNQIDVLDYCASGYVVARGADGVGKKFFILIKNTHKSNYHRHDDDLMLYLWVNGEVILGDGGLFSHNEKDKKRAFFRSPYAHSMPIISCKVIRDRKKLKECPSIKIEKNWLIKSHTYMWGTRVCRAIDLENIGEGKIKISDSVSSDNTPALLATNYFVPKVLKLKVKSGGASIETEKNNFVKIYSSNGKRVKIHKGWSGMVECSAIVSEEYGKYSDAFRIVLRGSSKLVSHVEFK